MLRTQDVVRLSGVTSRTLRHHDQLGLLHPATADDGGQRWYGPDELVRLQRMIRAVEATITRREMGMAMDEAEMFEGFADDPYAQEAQDRWPDQHAESQRRLGRMTKQEQAELFGEGQAITRDLGALFISGEDVASPVVQALIARHFAWVCAFWTPGREAYVGLGNGYVDDPRFTATYDAVAPGLAVFVRDAMRQWAEANLAG